MASRVKKINFSTHDTSNVEYLNKDLIWAKMKGFTPWPAMISEPTRDLLAQPRKAHTKCVFFFGSRNFAWIEKASLKPYEGAWKEQFATASKAATFKNALLDIEKYIADPTEVERLISASVATNHTSEADFDKIRDGHVEAKQERPLDTDEGAASDDAVSSSVNTVPAAVTKPKKSSKSVGAAKANANHLKRSHSPNISAPARKLPKISADLHKPSSNNRVRKSAPNKAGKSELDLKPVLSSGRRNVTAALLNRPVVNKPEPQAVDLNTSSPTLTGREIVPSSLTFGFLGMGIIGCTIVKDLMCTGHKMVIWNRTNDKCEPFVEAGAELKATPMDVVEAADVIFCCVSDPKASKDLVFGNCGVLQYKDLQNKAYVEMSTIDPDTSQDIAEGIMQANGRYLEVQLHGTREDAEKGMLIVLAGGDRTVFEDCNSCFKTIAKNTFFLGAEVGNACKVNLILQTMSAVSIVGLAEGLALADRFSISLSDILDIFELTSSKSQMLLDKGKEMARGEFIPQLPVTHLQKDLRLVLAMAENLNQAMPVTAVTNEVFKHTKRMGYVEHDASAVFVRSRF